MSLRSIHAPPTIPFVSKVTGVPLAQLAVRVMAGKTCTTLGVTQEVAIPYSAVKEAVFPFIKFPSVDIGLRTRMNPQEVMGLDTSFARALCQSQMSVEIPYLVGGGCSQREDGGQPAAVRLAQELTALGFASWPPRVRPQRSQRRSHCGRSTKSMKGRPRGGRMLQRDIQLVINTVAAKPTSRLLWPCGARPPNANIP